MGSYKVVQLSSVHPSHDTRIFHKVCKSLVAHGFDLDLIIQHPHDEIKDGINIVALPIATKKADRIFKIIPKLFLKAIKYSKKTIFHFHDPELIPIGYVLKMLGYKVIYDVHEDVPKSILSKEWIPSYIRKIVAVVISGFEKMALYLFDHIIVVTRSIEQRFSSSSTILIQNFPTLSNENITVKPNQQDSIFYIGDITLVRGLKEVIRAVDIVNQSQDLKFILGGKCNPKSLESELRLETGWKHTDFVGWVGKNEFMKYAERSYVGIVTFHPIPNHIEAQPNKLFEYMHAGLPVVASNFPLWVEIVENNKCGLLVNPMNPSEIANAILWIMDNPKEAQKMGENGRKAVLEKYNWAIEEKKLIKLYNNLS